MKTTMNKYFPYLLEIRKRLLLVGSVVLVSGALGFFYYEPIISSLIRMLSIQGINIVFTSPYQYLELAVSCALTIGIISAIPFIIWQLLQFLKPALNPREFKLVLFLIPLSLVLFAAGFAFGVLMMKYVVMIFQQNSARLQIGNLLDIGSLLSSIMTTASLMGLAFEFPLVLTTLMYFGTIKADWLAKQRLFAYLASFVFSMMLPPTDILSDVLLALPLVILFELTLILNRFIIKKAG